MDIRRKLRSHPELHAGALNDILFILLFFFLIVSTIANIVKVNNPKGTKDTKAKQHITVSIDKNKRFFIGTTPVDQSMLDTLLRAEILKFQSSVDTPNVVINADTIANWGEVFRIMRISKMSGAKVVANVK